MGGFYAKYFFQLANEENLFANCISEKFRQHSRGISNYLGLSRNCEVIEFNWNKTIFCKLKLECEEIKVT